MPTLIFTDANDTYSVTAAGTYDLIFLDGNDTLTVNGGTFTTGVMGEGDDVITLRSGDALIYGDGGSDRFEIYGGGFEARGGADNDSFNIRGGNNLILRGNGGDDTFTFYAGSLNIQVYGGDGNDVFKGGGQIISGDIYGGAGNDTFNGFHNESGTLPNLRGGTGDDVYRADPLAPANFIENAGEGIDTVEVSAGRNYTLPANIENLTVGAFSKSLTGAATLTGNTLNNVIRGYDNAETLNGLAGNDTLYGGAGGDTLNGGGGNDILDGQTGHDTMTGGANNDTYYVDNAGDAVIEASGGGTDLLRTKVDYTLPAYVENGMVDNPGGVHLTGNDGNNVLTGGAGIDFLLGMGGNDTLKGGDGPDAMAGGAGDDAFYVDDEFDLVSENLNEGVDTIYLNLVFTFDPFTPPPPGPVYYQIDANVENMVVTTFAVVDAFGNPYPPGLVFGNALNNVITDNNDSRTISGAAGEDTIYGNGGNDYLIGGDGLDTIVGGSGDDSIVGDGNGVASPYGDTLTGGAGADSFWYYTASESAPFITRVDHITDFETGSDTIHLNDDADLNTGGTQDWTVVASPTGAAGQLWIDDSDSANGNYVVFGDNNGDGLADLMIQLHAVSGFSASDIIL